MRIPVLLAVSACALTAAENPGEVVSRACELLDENLALPSGKPRSICLKQDLAGLYKENAAAHAAIRTILDRLPDPNLRLFTAAAWSALGAELRPGVVTAGIVDFCLHADPVTRELIVMEPLPGSSAARQGIRPLDRIVSVAGRRPASREELLAALRGPEGETIAVGVRRGDSLLGFSLRRERITPAAVSGKLLEDGIGVIDIRYFAPDTAAAVAHEIRRLAKMKPRGWILDLRDNPGGMLPAAAAIAGMFLDHGAIVYRTAKTEEHTPKPPLTSLPLVVLVNEATASAAEVLAAALRDNGRAKLAGSRTFGQGTAYRTFPLPDKSLLLVATAQLLRPGGDPLRYGLAPEVTFGAENWYQAAARLLERR